MPHVIYNCVRNIIEKIRGKTSPLRKWLRLTEEVCSTVYSEYLDTLRFHWVFFNTIYTMDFYYSSKCLRYMHRNSYTDAIVRSFISSCDCFESVGYAKMLTGVVVYTCVTNTCHLTLRVTSWTVSLAKQYFLTKMLWFLVQFRCHLSAAFCKEYNQ